MRKFPLILAALLAIPLAVQAGETQSIADRIAALENNLAAIQSQGNATAARVTALETKIDALQASVDKLRGLSVSNVSESVPCRLGLGRLFEHVPACPRCLLVLVQAVRAVRAVARGAAYSGDVARR